jgi:myosin heavy subunit
VAANVIERLFRGYSRRLFFRKIQSLKQESRRLATFTYFILQIQKSFRGYYSRKYRQNHANRKRYLQHVVLVGQEVRESMSAYAKKQIEDTEREKSAHKEKEFKQLTENLHHLVSTKQIRGVYQPPPHLLEVSFLFSCLALPHFLFLIDRRRL